MSHALAVDLVALDIAGTTVQEHGLVYRTLEDVVREAGADVTTKDVARWMGADKVEAVRALLAAGGAPEPARERVEEVHATFRARLNEAYAAQPPQPFPGVEEALGDLRAAGVKIALTTGFDRAITYPLLAAMGWDQDRVDAVLCADEVPQGRPAPHLIHRAMERTGATDVRRVLAAGDTPLDLQAGTNAGAGYVVGVLTGGVDEATLRAAPHTHILGSVAEIPALAAG